MLSLAGRRALVTGGAKRIGKAVAIALAERGCAIVVHYNTSGDEAERFANELRVRGVEAGTVGADLADPESADGIIDRTAWPIDILINSASIFDESTVGSVSPADVHRNVDVNAIAPFLLARRFAERLRERPEARGCIVNFLDTRITDFDRKHVAYALSKRMLFSMTRMLASELAPQMRVNAVAPGLVLPPPGKGREYLEGLKGTNPLGAIGTLGQITDAVLFLVSNEFVTGQIIYVDGGRHLKGSFYGT